MEKKKKILFAAYSLGLGGIETALVSLLNHLDINKYEITLILERKEGKFLKEINPEIHVEEYRVSESKNLFLRKLHNYIKRVLWVLKNYHHYDFAACYATYSLPGVHIALNASKNNAIWVHNNYYRLLGCNKEKMIAYFKKLKFHKFKKIVFVSNENRKVALLYCPQYEKKSIVCNNFINGERIIEKAKENIPISKTKTTFINVGRHEEHQKKITRILEATLKLKNDFEFEVWLLGEGPDTENYKQFVKENHLDSYIKFLGFQKNPYPYMKSADALLLSSEYEGYPVVFIESMILNLPIVSTKVSDYEALINKNGIFNDCTTEGVYEGMKEFLENGFEIKETFQYSSFNKEIENKLKKIINL